MRPLLCAFVTTLIASVALAQPILPLEHVEPALDARVRQELTDELIADGVSPARAATLGALAGDLPNTAYMVADFCSGCAEAHYWLANLTEEPVWALEVRVELQRGNDRQSYSMFVPVVPARSAARIGFRVPWPMVVTYEVGTIPPPSNVLVFDELAVTGVPLDAAVVTTLIEEPATFRRGSDELWAGGETDSLEFALRYVRGAALDRLAVLLVEAEGATAVRERAQRNMSHESTPALVSALTDAELGVFLDDATERPEALGAIVASVSDPCFERMVAGLQELPARDRRALLYAVVITTNAERLDRLTADVSDDDRDTAIRIGWQRLADGELLTRRLAYLQRLERSDEDRALAATTIANRRLHQRELPEGALPQVERLHRLVPDAFRDVYRDTVAAGQPFDVDRLIDADVNLVEYWHDTLPELRGCRGQAGDVTSLDRCADSIESNPELLAIARDEGLSAPFLVSAAEVLADDDNPGRVETLAARYVPYGLDASFVAEGICERRLSVFEGDRGPYIESARRLDPQASCVAEADAAIFGLDPATAIVMVVFILLLFAAAIFIVRMLRRRERALQEQIDEAMKD